MTAWMLLLSLTACKKDGTVVTDTVDTGPPGTPLGGVGDACAQDDGCAGDLVCASSLTCARPSDLGTADSGDACFASAECRAGLVCDTSSVCAAAGGPGSSGIGETCADTSDCQSALACFESVCSGFEMPLWEGIVCPELGNPFRVRFEIPRATPGSMDFYTLPFPNDARVSGGIDMAGHPVLSVPFQGREDVSAGFASAYSEDFAGFGPNQSVFLRMSDWPTFDTVLIGLPGQGSIAVVDVTPGSPSYGQAHPIGWKITSDQRYLCDPWIALYPSTGRPFVAGRTYAAVVGATLLSEDGVLPIQDPDFTAMLGGPPTDGALQGAWEAYAPLRDWLTDSGTDPSELAGGSVFTVLDPAEAATRIRDVVRGSAEPTAAEVVVCGDLPGPHADVTDATRGCFGEDSAFHEIQGALSVPHFQVGQRPFITPTDGGGADWSSGQPAIVGPEDVTFSLSVPTGTPPPTGWPVLLYGHDHAGNYRSFVNDGLAADWANVLLADGTRVSFAVISIDTWMSGPRRGSPDPTWLPIDPAAHEPTVLYTSPLNPLAARDNLTQSAADWYQVIRYLESVDWSGAASPTGNPITFDTSQVVFVGHGIGAKAGPMVVSREDAVRGGVFAAAGAYWTAEVAETRAPVRLAGHLAGALADPAIDRFQPVVSLGQGIVDRTDPLNQARYVHIDASANDKHVLHVVARDDPYVPEDAQYALARGLFTQQVVQDGLVPLDAIDAIDAPVTANVGPATAVTLVNTGTDPHRLLLDDPRTQAQVREFLGTVIRDGTPTVPLIP